MTTLVNPLVTESRGRMEEHDEQLLPGIPNDITLDHIFAKLSWRDFYSLSCVCLGWSHAIRSRQVYNARVRSHSTEALVLVRYALNFGQKGCGFALYAMRDNTCCKLPPIPNIARGFPDACECVALDGKVYVLGGCVDSDHSSNKVYVLDLAGQRQWKQCASMKDRRAQFGCGVLDEKIYVFGGFLRFLKPLVGSEVYDPKANAWSSIRTMPSWRRGHHIATVGAELVAHKGLVFNSKGSSLFESGYSVRGADVWEVYHPALDEWRVVKPRRQTIFSVHGKLYAVCGNNIHVYDVDQNSWTHLHSLSVAGPIALSPFCIESVVAVDDEVLGIERWPCSDEAGEFYHQNRGLIRGRGLGGANEEMILRRVPFPPPSADLFLDKRTYFIMDSIRV